MTHGSLFLVPGIGTELVLSENWTTRLPAKDKNALLCAMIGEPFTYSGDWVWTQDRIIQATRSGSPILLAKGQDARTVTIPARTRLKVIGVYITAKVERMDMLTFEVMAWPGPSQTATTWPSWRGLRTARWSG